MVARTKRSMKKAGLDPQRLQLAHISASEGARFAAMVDRFIVTMTSLGPTDPLIQPTLVGPIRCSA
jgi:coenzyme F420-reducing hydrogenase delta subunit